MLLRDKQRLLAMLLGLEGVIEVLAFFPGVMPERWMAAVHTWLGLGPFPASPLLDYIIRSACLLYGLHGVLLLVLATDVRRFRPVIIYVAASYFLAAVAFVGIDLVNAMPWWWTVGEVGSVFWLGGVLLLLLWLSRGDNAT